MWPNWCECRKPVYRLCRGVKGRKVNDTKKPVRKTHPLLIGQFKLSVEMLSLFIGLCGGHDRLMTALLHFIFPKKNGLFPQSLAAEWLVDPNQVHERGIVPEEPVSHPSDVVVGKVSEYINFMLPDLGWYEAVQNMMIPCLNVVQVGTRRKIDSQMLTLLSAPTVF